MLLIYLLIKNLYTLYFFDINTLNYFHFFKAMLSSVELAIIIISSYYHLYDIIISKTKKL